MSQGLQKAAVRTTNRLLQNGRVVQSVCNSKQRLAQPAVFQDTHTPAGV